VGYDLGLAIALMINLKSSDVGGSNHHKFYRYRAKKLTDELLTFSKIVT
jgi:hypothetical protein